MDINTLHKNACSGDARAVDQLFEVLSSRFRLFVHQKVRNRADAEEIVQKALMTIYAEYGNITFTTSFAAWACKVLDNRILDYLRTRTRESRRLDRSLPRGPDSLSRGGEADPELKRRLQECLRKLCRRNNRYARILNLHNLGYGTGEICRRLNLKRATLYSALSKARAMLDKCLEKGQVD